MVHPHQDPFISELVHRLSLVTFVFSLPFPVSSAFIPLTSPHWPRAVLPLPSLFIVSGCLFVEGNGIERSLTRLEDDTTAYLTAHDTSCLGLDVRSYTRQPMPVRNRPRRQGTPYPNAHCAPSTSTTPRARETGTQSGTTIYSA